MLSLQVQESCGPERSRDAAAGGGTAATRVDLLLIDDVSK
jgi:hypothetical protein